MNHCEKSRKFFSDETVESELINSYLEGNDAKEENEFDNEYQDESIGKVKVYESSESDCETVHQMKSISTSNQLSTQKSIKVKSSISPAKKHLSKESVINQKPKNTSNGEKDATNKRRKYEFE